MTDIQLTKGSQGYLPYLSHWSKHQEPAAARKVTIGHSDHWAKMKHKASNFTVVDKTGTAREFSADFYPHEIRDSHNALKCCHHTNGQLKHVGTKSFTDMMLRELHGYMPGDYIPTQKIRVSVLRTAANTRAKEGYKYWYREKESCTPGAKVWAGQKSSTLGISSF